MAYELLAPAHLTHREAASGILGSISLACWIFLLLPQLIENYRNGSAEAISLGFLFIWFIGDICNLAGALWAGLVSTVIAIGVYFCIADGVLIAQCLYYGIRNKRRDAKSLLGRPRGQTITEDLLPASGRTMPVGPLADEESPLLPSRERSGSFTIPGSVERRYSGLSERRRRSSARDEPLAKVLEETDESGVRLWFKNVLSVLTIIVVGTAGWAIAYGSGAWKPTSLKRDVDVEEMATGAQILGYASAVAYLGARLPQIYKNWKDKSCEGLSLLFFILSLLGNLTYGASILAHSTDNEYVLKNLPWLIGSLGTMVEDVMIFVQFHLYRQLQDGEAAVL
jgi:solute carrier family 66 (lysosomal lysine-arginine transporter), member 1